jgi:nitrogen regulatory protein P-II 2
VVEGRGQGSRALHAAEIPGINVRIETIVQPDVAERIVEYISKQYFADYEVIAYLADVQVVRGEKYRTPDPR